MKLHINIDHIATLRQARGTRYPDPVWAAAIAELAGADGITVHLREDRRHIQDRDVELLRKTVRTVLNLEMAATEEMVAIARRLRPDIVTLVPEKRAERTTEGGLDLEGRRSSIGRSVEELSGAGIPVSLFIDPTVEAVRVAHELHAPRIELHTGYYCDAATGDQFGELDRLAAASREGRSRGLHVAAGHGLDYPNVVPVAALEGITELNIGHAVIARAVFVGIDRAVRDMAALVGKA